MMGHDNEQNKASRAMSVLTDTNSTYILSNINPLSLTLCTARYYKTVSLPLIKLFTNNLSSQNWTTNLVANV